MGKAMHFSLFWSEEDGEYVCHLDDSYFSALGPTISEAIREMSVAITLLDDSELPWKEEDENVTPRKVGF